MAGANLRILTSAAELRRERERWDRLWKASESTSALSQAELLALEFEEFDPPSGVQVLVVEQDGHFVAGLPLVERGGLPGWKRGVLSGNCWSPTADLLLDPAADVDRVLALMISGLRATGWPIVDLHAFDPALERWRRFSQALESHAIQYLQRQRFPIALVRIRGDWATYIAGLSRNHRRQMRRMEKLADRTGGAELCVIRDFAPAEIEPWLRRGFGVEDRNWKGDGGTSVLRSPGMFDFLLRQAQLLAAKGQLHLTFLEKQGTPIAFEYGWASKGVYFAFKVGYDAAFAELTPSQLLRWRLFERLFDERAWHTVDFCGPVTRAVASWSNDQYLLNRTLVAPGRLSGRLALAAYKHLAPHIKRKGAAEPACRETSFTANAADELCAVDV